MSGLEQALAAARRSGGDAAAATRTAFIVGNTGKLGEEVLNALLESPRYSRVVVGVRKAMRSHVPRLESVVVPPDREGWDVAAALGRAPDDLFLCVEPPAKSFWKLAKPAVAISGAEAAALALRLRAAGASRVAVITPLEALLQLGMSPTLRDREEMAIHGAGFERMLVLRPSEAARHAEVRGFFPRVGATVMRALAETMTPKQLQPLRVRRVAIATVNLLDTMDPGVRVLGAAELRELLEPDATLRERTPRL